MKIVYAILLSLVIALPPAAAQTFVELVAASKQHDARWLAGEYNQQARNENLKVAGSVFYPQLAAFTGFNYDANRGRSVVNTEYTRHRLQVSQTLIDKKREYDYAAVQRENESEDANWQASQQAIYQQVIQARLDWHLANEQQTLLQKRLNTVSTQLQMVKRRAEGGVGTHLDVVLLTAELESVKADVQAAANTSEEIQQLLFKLTGLHISELPPLKEDFVFPPLPDLSLAWEQVLQTNPALRSGRYQVQSLVMRERAANADLIPTLSVVGEYGLTEVKNHSFGAASEDSSTDTSIGLQLRIPIWSGGRLWAGKRLAAAQRQAAEESLLDFERQLFEDLQNLHNTANSIIRRERSLRKAVEARTQLLAKTRIAWLEGVRVAQDILDAEQELFDSRRQQRALYYQYLGVLTQIAQLSGSIKIPFLQQLDSYFEAEVN